jgi:hypothetical protein
MPVTARYCNRCGVRISPFELESGEAIRHRDQYYCARCAKEVVPVAKAFQKPPALSAQWSKQQPQQVMPRQQRGPVKVGEAVSLFDGKTLSGWKRVGNVTCTVENCELVMKNNSAAEEGGIITDRVEQQRWFDYELSVSIKSSVVGGWRLVLRANFVGGAQMTGHSLRAGEELTADAWWTLSTEVAGTDLYVRARGSRKLLSRAVGEKPGAVAVLIRPGARVRIRDVRFTLRALK